MGEIVSRLTARKGTDVGGRMTARVIPTIHVLYTRAATSGAEDDRKGQSCSAEDDRKGHPYYIRYGYA